MLTALAFLFVIFCSYGHADADGTKANKYLWIINLLFVTLIVHVAQHS